MTMQTSTHRPVSRRINFRLLAFIVVVGGLVGYPVYLMLDSWGGTRQVGQYTELNLKAIGNFPFPDSGGRTEDVPQRWRELDGKKVLLQGEIFAPDAGSEMTNFQLVYSIQKCCFNGPPKVQERVFAYLPPGRPLPNYDQQVVAKVYGTLHVKVKSDGGVVTSVYDLDVEKFEVVGPS